MSKDASEKQQPANPEKDAASSSPSSSNPRDEGLAAKPTRQDLAYLLFLLFNLALTSHALQNSVRPIFGKTYGELSFHAGSLFAFILFSFALPDRTNVHRRTLEVVSVLQVVAAVGARSLAAYTILLFGEKPTVAAWVVHTALSFPLLGLGGAVWLHWTSKFMDQEPTKAGQIAIKVFSCVALVSVVKYFEPLVGDTILRVVELSPKVAMMFLATATYFLSVIFREPGSRASGETPAASGSDEPSLTKVITVLSIFTLMLAVNLPPYAPSSLTVRYQRFTPHGLIQVVDDRSTTPAARHLRLDSSIVASAELHRYGSVGDSLAISDALLEGARLAQEAKGRRALVIGAQSGASAKSLISSSHNTTIVDGRAPLVMVAQTFFGLPRFHQFVPQDPAIWMMGAKRFGVSEKFDVVIHDVFDGGELPARMFTMEFWDAVRSVMKENGVLAVKYTGKPSAVTFKSTLNMLRKKFRTCRAFHSNPLDQPPSSSPDYIGEVVILCTLSPDLPLPSSLSSKAQFSPRTSSVLSELDKREVNIASVLEGISPEKYLLQEEDPAVLRMWGKDAIVDYWKLMRRRYPASLWHTY